MDLWKALHTHQLIPSWSKYHSTKAWSIAEAIFSKMSRKAWSTRVGYFTTRVSVQCHAVWSSQTHCVCIHGPSKEIHYFKIFANVHMHSVLSGPASPTYPSRHCPHVCSGVAKEHSSRPIKSQSGTSVQSRGLRLLNYSIETSRA